MSREEVGEWDSGSDYGRLLLRAHCDDCWREIHGGNDQVAPASRLRPAPPLVEPKPTGLILAVEVGHLRQAITQLLDLAEVSGARGITIEDSGFSEIRFVGRERYGSRPWLRKMVSRMLTAKFRDRLVAGASRRGIAVVGVPAAHTSIWGRQHWLAPLLAQHHQVSGHTAAAVVLGRRALGHSARRSLKASPGVTASERRIEAAGQPADVVSYQVGSAGVAGTGCEGQSKFRRREGSHPSGARPETATATLGSVQVGKDRSSRPGVLWALSRNGGPGLSSLRVRSDAPRSAASPPKADAGSLPGSARLDWAGVLRAGGSVSCWRRIAAAATFGSCSRRSRRPAARI